jgi:hypothetical protein
MYANKIILPKDVKKRKCGLNTCFRSYVTFVTIFLKTKDNRSKSFQIELRLVSKNEVMFDS